MFPWPDVSWTQPSVPPCWWDHLRLSPSSPPGYWPLSNSRPTALFLPAPQIRFHLEIPVHLALDPPLHRNLRRAPAPSSGDPLASWNPCPERPTPRVRAGWVSCPRCFSADAGTACLQVLSGSLVRDRESRSHTHRPRHPNSTFSKESLTLRECGCQRLGLF